MVFSPQWHATGREAELAGSQIARGVTALGRADNTRLGNYTTAFFSLAIGLERLGKLIVVADHAIGHNGKFPDDKFLKDNFGHVLGLLLDHCEGVSEARRPTGKYSKRPNDRVHQGIIQTLSEFGRLTRYYNLDFLTGAETAKLEEPVHAWWKRVGEPILSEHYTARQQEKDSGMVDLLNEMGGENVHVRHHSETGESINDLATLVRRGGATRVIQRYGRLHVLQIVRWLTCLVFALAHEGARHKIEPLPNFFSPCGLPGRLFAVRLTYRGMSEKDGYPLQFPLHLKYQTLAGPIRSQC